MGLLEQPFYVGQARSRRPLRLVEPCPLGLRVSEQAPKLLARWAFSENDVKPLGTLTCARLPDRILARSVEVPGDGRRAIGQNTQLA